MTHNVIGDIHGTDVWKYIVADSLVNVFVGDFFDPYFSDITFDVCKSNFLNIIDYKRQHPETVLLWGNHELHYLFYGELSETYSRFDYRHAAEIQALIQENASFFNGIAYSVNNTCLVTHAGVSVYWYHRWLDKYVGQSPDLVAEQINNLWDCNYRAFLVRENMKGGFADDGPMQSPLWIRPWTLEKYNLFEGTPYLQIFGHTPCDTIENRNGLIGVDCLRGVKEREINEFSCCTFHC